MLSTVLLSVAKLTLLTLKPVPDFAPTSRIAWRFIAHKDDSGTLHRWITVDRWDADELTRAMHGWHVIGDMVMARMPMVLHVIEIGQTRGGRRACAWARGWRHPAMPNLRMRFRRTDGQDFTGWKPVYLADMAGGDEAVHTWVEQMWREGAAEPLMHHATIECPPDSTCENIVAQVLGEAGEMRRLRVERASSPWHALPMSRPACDQFTPCPFQSVCYSDRVVEVGELGLYQRREAKAWQTKSHYPHSSNPSLITSVSSVS